MTYKAHARLLFATNQCGIGLNSVERATLKWLAKAARAYREGDMIPQDKLNTYDELLGHAEEIIKRITMRPCNAKHALKKKKP